jgi:molybdopterin synthase catalytic subunit
MNITVRLFAGLRERAGADELVLADLPEPLDVAGLKRALQERRPELGPLGFVRGVVGTQYVPDKTQLSDGDEVALLPPVSGGSGGSGGSAGAEDAALAQGVFEISAAPLDPAACQRRVEHPSCGAVVLFTGITRERNRDREVTQLDYEAFEAMAGAEMGRIFARCRETLGDAELRMLAVHRTGTVGVGEPSVAIAVASPHRDAAFQAARFLIDELKASVPLWKKEVYADGHHWINDRS